MPALTLTPFQAAVFEDALPTIRRVAQWAAHHYPPRHGQDIEAEAVLAAWIMAGQLDAAKSENFTRVLVDKTVYGARDAGRRLKRQDELRAPKRGAAPPSPWLRKVVSLDESPVGDMRVDDDDGDQLVDLLEATGPRRTDPQERLELLELLEAIVELPPRQATALVLDIDDAVQVLGVTESRIFQLQRAARKGLADRGLLAA